MFKNFRSMQEDPNTPQIKYNENRGTPKFDFQQFPLGYFADNEKGKALRKQLVVRQNNTNPDLINELQTVFFSKENVDLINKQLILAVYRKSNKSFHICPQKEEDLLIIMRYVFIEYAKHLPYEIKEQITELNCKVISEILPTIMSNADQKIGYIRDISTQPIGPPLPVNTKNLERTLPSIANIMLAQDIQPAKLAYEEQIQEESNIQGLKGLQGFIY